MENVYLEQDYRPHQHPKTQEYRQQSHAKVTVLIITYNSQVDIGDLLRDLVALPEDDGTGNIVGADAMLDVLADNGGPTLAHALMTGSGAINGGNPGGCLDKDGSTLLIDQRSRIRPDRCDIGAFELGPLVEHVNLPIIVKPY